MPDPTSIPVDPTGDVADLCAFVRDWLDDIEHNFPENPDQALAAVTRASLRLDEIKKVLWEAEKRWPT
jgi:hypothetical protein